MCAFIVLRVGAKRNKKERCWTGLLFVIQIKKEAKKKRGSDAIATKNARHTALSLSLAVLVRSANTAFAEEENLWECNKLLSIQCHEFGVESNKKICQMNSKSSLNVFKLPAHRLFYFIVQFSVFLFFQCSLSLLLFYSLKFTAVQSTAGDNAGQNKLRMQASCAITCTTAARGRTCFHLLCCVLCDAAQRTPLISLIIALLYLIHLAEADFKIHEYLGNVSIFRSPATF
jgi:hypothetical protein